MAELGADEQWLSRVAETVEFLSLFDRSYGLVYANHPRSGVATGRGASVFDYLAPRFHDILRDAVERTLATGLPQHFESDADGPDGTTSHYSNWIFHLADRDLFAVIATDVTQPERIRQALQLSETTLRSVVASAPDSIMIVDRERRILFVNREEFGFRREDVLGRPVESFVVEPERAKIISAVEHVVQTGGRTSYETEVHTPDGRVRHFSTRLGPIVRDGTVDRVMLISTEITAEHEAKDRNAKLTAQLQHAQKMEALGQLTGGVAHDFNNLLTAIGGSISLAQKRLDRPQSASEFLQEASQSVRRAAALTQRLLAFSRKQNLLPRVLDVNMLVSGMEALLRRSLGETVLIDVRLSDRLWPCEIDPAQLENLLLNLAVNARDAMPRGGRLSIRTSNVDAAAGGDDLPAGVSPGEFILLSVSDDGDGMDEETLRQAFEPFFTTKEVGRGSGLGLSMVYGFVQQSGGQVMIDSQPGLGTTVRVYLPRTTAQPEAGAGGPAQPQEPEGDGEVVLVVEDEPAVRRMATQLIEELGYRTVVAADAATALDRLERTPDVALLFTDIVLPGGVSGVELADEAKERCPGLGVVFASGYTRSEMTDQDRLDPELRFLQKPYSARALAHALAHALSQSASKRSAE